VEADRGGVAKVVYGCRDWGNVGYVCWSAGIGMVLKAWHVSLSAWFRAVWSLAVLDFWNQPPHHNWHPYVRTGMMVEMVSCRIWT
jgi:hypothetical protein